MTKPTNTGCPVPDFSEEDYLRENRDVSEAVASGVFRSGWDHFLLYGHAEDRPGTPGLIEPAINQVLKDPRRSPVPPGALRVRVHGAEDLSSFIRLGKTVAFDLYTTLSEQGIDAGGAHRILDFGCGCGRVLTWFSYLYPESRLFATDIDAEAIQWCQQHLGERAMFSANGRDPPLPCDNGQFDIVYSVSIFTHLPEAMQFAWLEELNRITRPGALLVLTVRGARFFPSGSGRAQKRLARDGFYYLKGKGTHGLPAFYQTSYHHVSYIMREWSRYFDIPEVRDEGIAGRQDLVLCRKR